MIDTQSQSRTHVLDRFKAFKLAAQATVCLVMVAITWALSPLPGRADDRFWNNPTGGAFGTAGNWNPGSVPGTGDVAIFDLSNIYAVTFGFSPTNQRLLVRGGTVTFDLAGQTYSLTQTGGTNPSIVVGQNSGDVADLRILNGTLSGQIAFIGHVAGSQGTVRVTGSSAIWNNANSLLVGTGGQGTLLVNSKGKVTSLNGFIGNAIGSTGSTTIAGSGSSWTGMNTFVVGNSGQGILNVQSGGLVSSSNSYIGRFSNATGAATVTGTDSTWNSSGNFMVGGSDNSAGGTGSLTASNGGRVNVGGTLRVWGGTGTLTVDGGLVEATNIVIDPTATLNWDNQGILRVKGGSITGLHNAGNIISIGSSGGQRLELVQGATLANATGYLGRWVGETGLLRVHGTGSQWNNSGNLYIGFEGHGTLSIESGGVVSNDFPAFIGVGSDGSGTVNVTGSASQWNNSSNVWIGNSGQGTLSISEGGVVSNKSSVIGVSTTGNGTATVSGSGSQWNHSQIVSVGQFGHGILTIEDGGSVTSANGSIGQFDSGTGTVNDTGSGSQWANSGELRVGHNGHGTLSIESGGVVSNHDLAYIGASINGSGTVNVTGSGSQWANSGELRVGENGHGTLSIESGGRYVSNGDAYLGWYSGSTGSLTVTGAGSEWSSNQLIVGRGGQGELTISNGGKVTADLGAVGLQQGSAGLALVTGSNSQWSVGDFWIGSSGNGTMIIEGGGTATSFRSDIGISNGGNGQVVVNGAGSQWVTTGDLKIGVHGIGAVHVTNGGSASSNYTLMGFESDSYGSAYVQGAGSVWNTSALHVGVWGSGELNILGGGTVTSLDGYLGSGFGGTGTTTVSGSGSRWNLINRLELGRSFDITSDDATLTIGQGGTVDVGGLMRLYDGATVNLHGGTLRLNSEQFTYTPASTINYLSGTLQLGGNRTIGTDVATTAFFGTSPNIGTGKHLHVEGTANLFAPVTLAGGTFSVGNLQNASLLNFNSGTFNLTDANLSIGDGGLFGDTLMLNSGQLFNVSHTATVGPDGALIVNNGGRFSANTIFNQGDVYLGGNNARIVTSHMTTMYNQGLVSGAGRIDGSFVNQSGGIVELEAGKRLTFGGSFDNQSGGRITGRGLLVAQHIDNYGQMLFSGGFTDIHAPIVGWSDSQMIITGGGTTTVFGDVEIKGGAELRISDFSNGVFFDHVQMRNGSLLTGGGNAYFEGSLGIGDSPSRQEFHFNVTLGPTSNLLVEIAGTDPILPEFDQFIFHRNLTLQGGALTLDLIGLNPGDFAYQPQLGDSFNIFEVHGQWTGQFGSYFLPTLGKGLEWNLSQLYSHGSIFVSQVIPEPGTALILCLALAGFLSYRKRPGSRQAT